MSLFEHPEFYKHEFVAFKNDRGSGLKAIVAIHSSQLGPAVGGCRMYPYPSSEDALTDVLRLSRGMTYKTALAGLPLGGGKAVILGDPKTAKNRTMLHAMAEFINQLNGQYITAEDSGTSASDMAILAEKTQFVTGLATQHGNGDPSPSTAYGVFCGIKAAVRHKLDTDLQGVTVAVQGVGNVGKHLVQLLVGAGATVRITDIDQQLIAGILEEHPLIQVIAPDQFFSCGVDILAPCAMGAVLNPKTIDKINASIVAGSANNQLATADIGHALFERGIVYAPDYVINAGGVIDIYYQRTGDTTKTRQHIERIERTLLDIFTQSSISGLPSNQIADQMAEALLHQRAEHTVAA